MEQEQYPKQVHIDITRWQTSDGRHHDSEQVAREAEARLERMRWVGSQIQKIGEFPLGGATLYRIRLLSDLKEDDWTYNSPYIRELRGKKAGDYFIVFSFDSEGYEDEEVLNEYEIEDLLKFFKLDNNAQQETTDAG